MFLSRFNDIVQRLHSSLQDFLRESSLFGVNYSPKERYHQVNDVLKKTQTSLYFILLGCELDALSMYAALCFKCSIFRNDKSNANNKNGDSILVLSWDIIGKIWIEDNIIEIIRNSLPDSVKEVKTKTNFDKSYFGHWLHNIIYLK